MPQSRDAIWRTIFARPAGIPNPPDNPANGEKISLGYDLFRDGRLSASGDRSCASCHDPGRSFADGRPKAVGLGGGPLTRNVPTLYGAAWGKAFFWDGRAPSLEAQVRFPVLAADELAGDFGLIASRLRSDAAMTQRFARAFPEHPEIGETTIARAIAAYERTLVPPQTRFDLWVSGKDDALTPLEGQGFDLFVGKAGCVACHGGWRFTDDGFHDIGLPGDDPGRGAVAGGVPGLAQFKTPSLRELALTAPYMHDGSLSTLRDVVNHYAGGLIRRPSLAANVIRDLELSEREKEALIAFLGSLSSESIKAPGP